MLKRILFIDRDGTILKEPADEQIDSFDKFEFVPGAIGALSFLSRQSGRSWHIIISRRRFLANA